MKKVKIIPRKGGRPRLASEQLADALVRLGTHTYAELTVKTPALEEMDYNELRALAARRGVTADGRKKEDYIKALRSYNRRDMQAKD
jgi:hypothetical protein